MLCEALQLAPNGVGRLRSGLLPTIGGQVTTTRECPLNPNPNPHFEVVKLARTWLKGQVETRTTERTATPSTKTVELYRREMVRLLGTGDPWQAAADTQKKATFFVRRAAIMHFCRDIIERGLRAQDQIQRGGLDDPAQKEAWVAQVMALKNALNLAEKAPAEPPVHLVKRRQTKRVDLFKLPENWREVMISRLPKYREAAAVSAISGCRPAELVKGIEVSATDGMLKIRILGAKVSQNSGQEWRELSFGLPSANPLAVILGRIALEKGGQTVVKIDDAKAFSGAVREAGKRAFPQFGRTVTPYSFRHQVASDLKAAELGDQISAALGHLVSDTRGSYGEWGAGNGSMAPSAITAARAIKNDGGGSNDSGGHNTARPR